MENRPIEKSPRWPAPRFRVLESRLFWLCFVLVAFSLPILRSLQRPQPVMPPVLSELPDFHLTDQEGRPLTRDSFRGSVVVTNFIFTSCPDVCPLLTKQMAEIQKRLQSVGPAIRLLSISVDPATDTPAVLKEYSKRFNANPHIWTFATGPLAEIEKVIVQGFKIGYEATAQAAPAGHEHHHHGDDAQAGSLLSITHGQHFVIFDQLGRIRSYRMANDTKQINQIIQDIAILANSDPYRAVPAAR